MAEKKTRPVLQDFFKSGKIPTESNFADLIESGINQKDDGLQKAKDTPLKIQAPATTETDPKTPKDLILFYENIDDAAAKWRIGTRAGNFEIGRGTQTDFLIDADGKVAIGTTAAIKGVFDVRGKMFVTENGTIEVEGSKNSFNGMIETWYANNDRYGLGQFNNGAMAMYTSDAFATSSIQFGQMTGAAAFRSQMTIDHDGKVGIGTLKPLGELSISNVKAQANSPDQKIGELTFVGFNRTVASASILAQSPSFDDQSHLIFKTSNSGSGATEKMRITSDGNVGIGTTTPGVALEVKGTANIWAGESWAVKQGNMAPGSLTIGNTKANFGGGNSWNPNTAGLLLETLDNTEIAVHDAGTRVTSLMYFEGASVNRITIGRDMGWGVPSTLVLNGNVGIGKSDPGVALEVAQNKAIRVGNANLSSGGDYAHLSTHTWYSGSWQNDGSVGALYQIGGQSHVWYRHDGKNTFTNEMTLSATGNLGIGADTPGAKLHVKGGAIMPAEGNSEAAGILFPPDVYGGSGDRAYIRYYARTGETAESTTLEIGNLNDTDDHIALTPGGNVGIGTIKPTKAKLVVEGSRNPGNYLLRSYMDANGGIADHNKQWGEGSAASIWASNEIVGTAMRVQSDSRVKKVIESPDPGKDLLFINKLNPVKYRFIDTIENGYEIKSGFIAQDVEKINPAMVKRSTNFIPNVYCQAEEIKYNARAKTLCISVAKSHDCVAGDKVKIITDKRELELTVESVSSENKLILAGCEEKTEKVFVFGKEVRDFLTLDYNSIFTKGIGAIQELSNQVKELQEECAQRKAELEAIKSEMPNIRRNKTETVR